MMIYKTTSACLLLVLGSQLLWAQAPRPLPKTINHAGYNTVYPAVSGDGKTLIYMTDYSQTGDFVVEISHYQGGKWQSPRELDVLGSSIVNNWGGYALNYDGTAIYFSSRRSDGVGKYDIWYAELQDGQWSRPKNIGKPVNSAANEGNPSISADEQHIYFMRCENMSNEKVSGCKIYHSERGPRGWKEPEPLPPHINTGNTTSPRIMADGKTLFFASDRPGGKGGVDIWMTRKQGDHWSEPVNVAPANTPENDYFFTASLRSLGFVTTHDDNGKLIIAELRLPREYRTESVIIRQGTVKDEAGQPLAAEAKIYNLEKAAYESRLRTGSKGDFIMVIPAGGRYDVGYNDIRLQKLYQGELVDTRDLVAPRREYPNIVLRDLLPDMTFALQVFAFKPFTAEIDSISVQELNRLARLLKQHPEYHVEIGAYQQQYLEDSVPSSDDLTEFRFDTVIVYEPAIPIDTMANAAKDSVLTQLNDTLAATTQDTLLANQFLERMAAPDSVAVEKLINVYHNDRTPAEAAAVMQALVDRGIAADRLSATGYRDQPPPVPFPPGRQRMIVIHLTTEQ